MSFQLNEFDLDIPNFKAVIRSLMQLNETIKSFVPWRVELMKSNFLSIVSPSGSL